jgi:hypothetical protein
LEVSQRADSSLWLRLSGQRVDPRATAAEAAVGAFVTFDVPDAVNAIRPVAINNGGAASGFYIDASGAAYGFLLSPH